MTDARHLADVEAIKQLKARYFRFLDMKQWDEYRSVFAPDLEVHIAESRSQPSTADELVAAASTHLAGATTVHHGHMPEIEILDDFNARGVWAMYDYVDMPVGSDRPSFRGFGHYHEEYRKIDGQWFISALTLTRLRLDTWPAGEAPPA